MVEESQNKKYGKKFVVTILITLLIFFLELIYLHSPKIEWIDGLFIANFFVLFYLWRKKTLISHNDIISTLWTIFLVTLIVHTSVI